MDIERLLEQLTLEEKAALCAGLDFCHTKPVERLGIPAAMMCDGPHGLRKQEGAADNLGINESIETVSYPTASALAASFDRSVTARLGKALGEEFGAQDVAMLLGPGLNIKRSPLCGRNFEYFSEDPYLAGELAASYVQSLQGTGVAACAKHFAANNQETLRMSGNSVVDERTLREIYLPAFEAVVKQGGIRAIMSAYNAVNGTYCAENKTLLTDILRDEWGFEGLTVTDWGGIQDQVKCLLAGLDLEMPGCNDEGAKKIAASVREGRVEEAVLDRAVRHILALVDEGTRLPGGEVASYEARMELAAELAAECAVLLKNEGEALPLRENEKVAFIGAFAQTPRYQGAGSSYINVPHPVGALEAAAGLDVAFAPGYSEDTAQEDPALVVQAVEAARQAQVAVVFAGLTATFETEGIDRKTLALPENQNQLIEAVAAAQPNTIVVLHAGAPVELPWLSRVRAVLCMYLGGANVGTATVRLLFGRTPPSGKLAETWPLKLADTPAYLNFPGTEGEVEYREGVYVGYRYYDKKQMEVLFPFGHGLSYTSFAYSGLELDKARMQDTDTLAVTCRVKNTGSVAAMEAVQLYVRDVQSTVGRPLRELKGFEKVHLAPGEEKQVSFVLGKRAFAYYEPKLGDWYVEPGSFVVEVGASSRDIRLSAAVEVDTDVRLPVTFTRNTPMSELQKTEKGQALFESMLSGFQQQALAISDELDEGGAELIRAQMCEMPLKTVVNYGGISEAEMEGMLAMLNSEQ